MNIKWHSKAAPNAFWCSLVSICRAAQPLHPSDRSALGRFSQSRDQQMNPLVKFAFLLGLVCFACAAEAKTIVFDNFGPNDSYDVSHGYTLAVGLNSTGLPPNTNLDQGALFIPSDSGYLSDIWLAVGLGSGANELDVWLMDTVAGQPGSILESFHFSNAMGPFGSNNPPLHAGGNGSTFLTAGLEYWLIASLSGPNAAAAWNLNDIGDQGPITFRENLGPWQGSSAGETINNVFRVAVPEPGTLGLIGLGFGVMGWGRKARGGREVPLLSNGNQWEESP
jgi:hypothetical protein